jgi:hypothetical protein
MKGRLRALPPGKRCPTCETPWHATTHYRLRYIWSLMLACLCTGVVASSVVWALLVWLLR